ncbi:MAG TPA: hypothetical protein VGX92_18525 [Pyrinomonadaceae bacterium]|jgi:hypothetical protein|nr:hypothetical protein [Pyrinomonadaceae bacterium]
MEKYYAVSPPRHAEKAYQPRQGDKYPTLSTVPTTAGPSGLVILLVSNLYNRPPFGQAEAQVVDYDSLVKYGGNAFPSPELAQQIISQHPDMVAGQCSGMTPYYGIVECEALSRVTVRVLTGGTKAKALSMEDFNAAGYRV